MFLTKFFEGKDAFQLAIMILPEKATGAHSAINQADRSEDIHARCLGFFNCLRRRSAGAANVVDDNDLSALGRVHALNKSLHPMLLGLFANDEGIDLRR
jgi:hypothetical protein